MLSCNGSKEFLATVVKVLSSFAAGDRTLDILI